ncbi:MAG: hypothetical protein PUG48_03050 [Clostridia bacterium]|nr:hypothetical protein [Clostridia bacterium]
MKKQKRLRLIIPLIMAVAVLSMGGISLTTAHLFEQAEIVNTADKGTVENSIDENFNGTEKTNVKIKNTGSLNSYIRVALVPIWRDSDGNPTTLKTDGTYEIMLNTDDWFMGNDGFYYCKTAIPPQKFTPVLIKTCTVKDGLGKEYNDKFFDFQILAQSIQSEPEQAVIQSWGQTVDDSGNLTG